MEKQKAKEKEIVIDENKKRTGSINNSNEIYKGRTKIVIVVVIATIIISAFILIAVINKFNNNIYKRVSFEGIDLSNKPLTEIDKIVGDYSKEVYNRSIIIYQGETMLLEVTSEDLGVTIDITNTIKQITEFGRTGNIIKDNIDIIKAWIFGKNFEVIHSYNNSKMSVIMDKILISVQDKVVDDSFQVVDDNLVITRGKSGLDFDKDKLIQDLIYAIIGHTNSSKVISYTIETYTRKPVAIDVDVVYSKVYKEAKNAKVDETKKPAVFESHEYGMSFDKEELRSILDKKENLQEGKEITFKLDILEPSVKLGDLKWELYSDLLGTYTTTFTTGVANANRNNNIMVAARYLDGTIVMPGATFSFNQTVGNCGSAARGFKMATIYSGGKVEQGMGGGVCQVSSTLYNAVIYANLEIVARDNHGYTVSYVACGRDATIYYPYLDFKFKNNRNYPIKIVTSYNSGGKITTSIYGTKEDNEYDVEIESYILSRIPRGTTYVNDNTLPIGTQKTDIIGQDGFTSIAYKVLKKNGKVVSKTVLSNDTYSPMNNIIKVGTKPIVVDPYQE